MACLAAKIVTGVTSGLAHNCTKILLIQIVVRGHLDIDLLCVLVLPGSPSGTIVHPSSARRFLGKPYKPSYSFALDVRYVLPYALRPFDRQLRKALYSAALIPAARRQLEANLAQASFVPDQAALLNIRTNQFQDGFTPSQLTYKQDGSLDSRWTKASLLLETLEREDAQNIKVSNALERIFDLNNEALHTALERKHRSIKEGIRELYATVSPTTSAYEIGKQKLRDDCQTLLDSLYQLISRVALVAFKTRPRRIVFLRALGFRIPPASGGPLPSSNEMAWLLLLMLMLLCVPLLLVTKLHTIDILLMAMVSTVAPVYIVAFWPNLLRKRQGGDLPPILFPIAVLICVGAITFLISVGYRTIAELRSPGLVQASEIEPPATVLNVFTNKQDPVVTFLLLVGFSDPGNAYSVLTNEVDALKLKRKLAAGFNRFIGWDGKSYRDRYLPVSANSTNILNTTNAFVLRHPTVQRRLILEKYFPALEPTDLTTGLGFVRALRLAVRIYSTRSWPWTILLMGFSCVVAVRMQVRAGSRAFGPSLRALVYGTGLQDVLWIGAFLTLFSAFVAIYSVRQGTATGTGWELWLRIIVPIESLATCGSLSVAWFRRHYKDEDPALSKTFRKLPIGIGLSTATDRLREVGFELGAAETEKVLTGQEWEADRTQALDRLVTSYYVLGRQFEWSYILGFDSKDVLKFKTEGIIQEQPRDFPQR